jgi:hypothetical protein
MIELLKEPYQIINKFLKTKQKYILNLSYLVFCLMKDKLISSSTSIFFI